MGTSAHAHLMYGYDLGSEDDDQAKMPAWWLERDDLDDDSEAEDDFVAAALERLVVAGGFTEPEPAAPAERTYDENDSHFQWYLRKGEHEQALGVTIESYGHHEYPCYLLCAKEIEVAWGESKRIEGLDGLQPANADVRLAWAADVLQLPGEVIKGGPAWLLVASYG
jgi:hypothetical protein